MESSKLQYFSSRISRLASCIVASFSFSRFHTVFFLSIFLFHSVLINSHSFSLDLFHFSSRTAGFFLCIHPVWLTLAKGILQRAQRKKLYCRRMEMEKMLQKIFKPDKLWVLVHFLLLLSWRWAGEVANSIEFRRCSLAFTSHVSMFINLAHTINMSWASLRSGNEFTKKAWKTPLLCFSIIFL